MWDWLRVEVLRVDRAEETDKAAMLTHRREAANCYSSWRFLVLVQAAVAPDLFLGLEQSRRVGVLL